MPEGLVAAPPYPEAPFPSRSSACGFVREASVLSRGTFLQSPGGLEAISHHPGGRANPKASTHGQTRPPGASPNPSQPGKGGLGQLRSRQSLTHGHPRSCLTSATKPRTPAAPRWAGPCWTCRTSCPWPGWSTPAPPVRGPWPGVGGGPRAHAGIHGQWWSPRTLPPIALPLWTSASGAAPQGSGALSSASDASCPQGPPSASSDAHPQHPWLWALSWDPQLPACGPWFISQTVSVAPCPRWAGGANSDPHSIPQVPLSPET